MMRDRYRRRQALALLRGGAAPELLEDELLHLEPLALTTTGTTEPRLWLSRLVHAAIDASKRAWGALRVAGGGGS